MQATTQIFKKIKDKLPSKQRVILIYASALDTTYPKSIEEIAQMFGNNEEYILENLKNTFKKFPDEIATILNLA